MNCAPHYPLSHLSHLGRRPLPLSHFAYNHTHTGENSNLQIPRNTAIVRIYDSHSSLEAYMLIMQLHMFSVDGLIYFVYHHKHIQTSTCCEREGNRREASESRRMVKAGAENLRTITRELPD